MSSVFQNELSSAAWDESSQSIAFADFRFNITYHRLRTKPPEEAEKDESKGEDKTVKKKPSQGDQKDSEESEQGEWRLLSQHSVPFSSYL